MPKWVSAKIHAVTLEIVEWLTLYGATSGPGAVVSIANASGWLPPLAPKGVKLSAPTISECRRMPPCPYGTYVAGP